MVMNFSEWEASVPKAITADTLWKVEAYRLALFASDVCWKDVQKLSQKRMTRSLADQLYRSVGSVGANLAEGYSRGTGKDRARFYEYALGSARESRDWYFKARFVLGEEVANHRLSFFASIIRLLLKMVPQQRGQHIREPKKEYTSTSQEANLKDLLQGVPLLD